MSQSKPMFLAEFLVVGGTGLIGRALIQRLSDEQLEFLSIARRAQAISKKHQLIVNFAQDEELRKSLCGKTLYYCFGTTMKAAGSRENFIAIEYGIGRRILKLAKESGVQNLILVSSQGASAQSPILYSRIKGQIEEFAKSLGYKSVCILRPSLLLGKREESRVFEGFAQKIFGSVEGYMKGPLQKVRPIRAELVAERMLQLGKADLSGVRIYENDQLHVGFKT